MKNTSTKFHGFREKIVDSYGKEEQEYQFISSKFVAELRTHAIQINMDEHRRCLDNANTEDDLMRKIGRLEIENDFLRSVSLACGLNPEKLK